MSNEEFNRLSAEQAAQHTARNNSICESATNYRPQANKTPRPSPPNAGGIRDQYRGDRTNTHAHADWYNERFGK